MHVEFTGIPLSCIVIICNDAYFNRKREYTVHARPHFKPGVNRIDSNKACWQKTGVTTPACGIGPQYSRSKNARKSGRQLLLIN